MSMSMDPSTKNRSNGRSSRRRPKHNVPPASSFSSSALVDESGAPFAKFQEKINLNPASKAALAKMGLVTMTEIQDKTFDPAVAGKDVLARARTGTGKTLAFLLPSIERIRQNPIKDRINMLVLSPTRELTAQIGEQARALLSGHGTKITHQVIVGGSSKNEDIRRFEKTIPTILLATPGRLRDHLQSTKVKGVQFSKLFQQTQILVLDEMDRLLDMGFRREVEDIISYLPTKQRQTLLFSATIPSEVREIIDKTMRSDYVTVDCIHDADASTHTSQQIDQSHVVIPDKRLVASTIQILLHLMEKPKSKMVVFFPTAHLVGFYSNVFNNALKKSIIEIHSRKSQNQRTNASNRFRAARTGVLFTSDVSARGVDYPDVSHVVQVGMADSRESYIHRLGRTGRAGKNGEGLLLLSETESAFLAQLDGLDLPLDQKYAAMVDAPLPPTATDALGILTASIGSEQDAALLKSGKDAYRSMLGFYKGQLRQLGIQSTAKLVTFVNGFAHQIGFDEMPGLQLKTLRVMGLDRATGLNVDTENSFKRKPQWDDSSNPAFRKKSYGGGAGRGTENGGGMRKRSGSHSRNRNY